MDPADMDTKTEKTTGASPMNPERLADLREGLAWNVDADADRLPVPRKLVEELLADRDHREADARQWENMCDVAADKLLEARAEAKRLDAEVRKTDALLIQALTKRDDARAEAKRYRDRCPAAALEAAP